MTGGLAATYGVGFGTATVTQRIVGGTVDAGSQIAINMYYNGGNMEDAARNVNATSVLLSSLNPNGSAVLNVGLSSAFEVRLGAESSNILTGKGMGEVGTSALIGGIINSSVQVSTAPLGKLGNSMVANATNRGDAILTHSSLGASHSSYGNTAAQWAAGKGLIGVNQSSSYTIGTVGINLFSH
ncbi:MAG: hypothetical protein WBG62_19325 [Cyclobacteriaceae bacterium]